LLRNEPSQEAKNRALEEAVSIKRLDSVQLVTEHGAEIKAVPLIDVLLTSKPELIRYFLENGADAITDHPFESAFRKEVWTSWKAFTRYKKTHTELATELQKQADCAFIKSPAWIRASPSGSS
jgi:ribulose bisphosphate carboxylase small subunit